MIIDYLFHNNAISKIIAVAIFSPKAPWLLGIFSLVLMRILLLELVIFSLQMGFVFTWWVYEQVSLFGFRKTVFWSLGRFGLAKKESVRASSLRLKTGPVLVGNRYQYYLKKKIIAKVLTTDLDFLLCTHCTPANQLFLYCKNVFFSQARP